MPDEQVILSAERLRDGLNDFKSSVRKRYRGAARPVAADDLRRKAAQLAETWLVNLAPRPEITAAIPSDLLADLSVQFQRLLTFSEHSTMRSRYDATIKSILRGFNLKVVIPLKQGRGTEKPVSGERVAANVPSERPAMPPREQTGQFYPTAFVGHSFSLCDRVVAECVKECLAALGIAVVTGKKPQADRISSKIKRLIQAQYLFVGIFTRREKIARKNEWTTSIWAHVPHISPAL